MIKADYVPGQVIVRTRGDNSRALASSESFADKYGATVADKFEFGQSGLLDKGEMMQLRLPAGMTTEQAIAKMKNDPAVAYVEPNYIYRLDPKEQQGAQPQPPATPPASNSAEPNDLVPELWGMNNTGQNGGTADADIDAAEAWQIHTGRNDAPIIAALKAVQG